MMKQAKQLTPKQQFRRQAIRNTLGLLLALAIVVLSIYLPPRLLQLQQQNMMGQFKKSILDTVSLDPLTSEPASSIDSDLLHVESFSKDEYDAFIARLSSMSSSSIVMDYSEKIYYDDIVNQATENSYTSIETLIASGILPQFDFSQYYMVRVEPIASSYHDAATSSEYLSAFTRIFFFSNTGIYSAVVTFDSVYGRIIQFQITGTAPNFDENMRNHLLQYAGYLQILDYLDTPEVTKNGNIRAASAYTKDRKALVSASVERLFESAESGLPTYQCSFSIQSIEK